MDRSVACPVLLMCKWRGPLSRTACPETSWEQQATRRNLEPTDWTARFVRGPASNHGIQVVSGALRRLATDDLLLLIGALEGPDPGKALSAELLVSAGERLQSAMETECLQAGFKSLAEFDRLYPATTTPTSFRKHRTTP